MRHLSPPASNFGSGLPAGGKGPIPPSRGNPSPPSPPPGPARLFSLSLSLPPSLLPEGSSPAARPGYPQAARPRPLTPGQAAARLTPPAAAPRPAPPLRPALRRLRQARPTAGPGLAAPGSPAASPPLAAARRGAGGAGRGTPGPRRAVP